MNSEFILENILINEDKYWCSLVPFNYQFKIATTHYSLKFSSEVNPLVLYKNNNNYYHLTAMAG